MTTPAPAVLEEPRDLGFGTRVAQQARTRFVNRDGSFNVVRRGLPFALAFNPYHALITMSWPRFYGVMVSAYLAINLAFAAAYVACGPGALHAVDEVHRHDTFVEAFFFSVQTLATIGYGAVFPHGVAANAIVAVEALFGVLGFSLATGLTFARFARPGGRFLFSHRSVVAPYRGGTGLMFRVINPQESQLLEVKAQVLLGRMEGQDRRRSFRPLKLERDGVLFFPLHWTVVHPIDEASPLYGVTAADLVRDDAEILILLTGVDETSGEAVHSRMSYKPEEIAFGARFADMLLPEAEGVTGIDFRRLDAILET